MNKNKKHSGIGKDKRKLFHFVHLINRRTRTTDKDVSLLVFSFDGKNIDTEITLTPW